jgi:hypothetical protein
VPTEAGAPKQAATGAAPEPGQRTLDSLLPQHTARARQLEGAELRSSSGGPAAKKPKEEGGSARACNLCKVSQTAGVLMRRASCLPATAPQ